MMNQDPTNFQFSEIQSRMTRCGIGDANADAWASSNAIPVIEALFEKIRLLEKDASDQEKEYANLEEKLTKAEDELYEAKEEKDELQLKLNRAEDDLYDLRGLQEKYAALEDELYEAKTTVSELLGEVSKLETELGALQRD